LGEYNDIAQLFLRKFISDNDVEIIYLNGNLKYKSDII
jgi:hypothetical protein